LGDVLRKMVKGLIEAKGKTKEGDVWRKLVNSLVVKPIHCELGDGRREVTHIMDEVMVEIKYSDL